MKRILSLILAALILASAAVAAAEPSMTPEQLHEILQPNLATMPEEDIRVMVRAIQIELFNRGQSAVMPQGEYTTGVDIPAGRYTFTVSGKSPYATIWHYPTDRVTSTYYTISDKYGLSVSLTLKDGDRIRVEHQEVTVGPYVGLSW